MHSEHRTNTCGNVAVRLNGAGIVGTAYHSLTAVNLAILLTFYFLFSSVVGVFWLPVVLDLATDKFAQVWRKHEDFSVVLFGSLRAATPHSWAPHA